VVGFVLRLSLAASLAFSRLVAETAPARADAPPTEGFANAALSAGWTCWRAGPAT
jgi:hypothetical protein